ncbi:MAG: hypothetical protein COB85_09885 [Bacteroidetes bacterium]|nr:MAG: hypothetical protein COB85_09885 [Bacteroidota bacterium]
MAVIRIVTKNANEISGLVEVIEFETGDPPLNINDHIRFVEPRMPVIGGGIGSTYRARLVGPQGSTNKDEYIAISMEVIS